MKYIVTITKIDSESKEENIYESEYEYPDDMDDDEVLDAILSD